MNEVRALLLAAGVGNRLRPLTDFWPKCLMPIGNRPLLEYWLETMHYLTIRKVLVNFHHHSEIMKQFLTRPHFEYWVDTVFEPTLLGTAGTLKFNYEFFRNETTLFIHADNWCQCDFEDFITYHQKQRPSHCPITMMTFNSTTPQTCGIMEKDSHGIVYAFHEKVVKPAGKIANGAVYLLEPEVLDWLIVHRDITDFSTEVLPHFMGRIATWHNKSIHRDIGALPMLKLAQSDPKPPPLWPQNDLWQQKFLEHSIHQQIIAS